MKLRLSRALAMPLALAAGSLLFIHLLFILFPSTFNSWNQQALDRLYQIRAGFPERNIPYDSMIVHVSLSDVTLSKLSDQYLNRGHLARIGSNLSQLGARAQFWDFIFPARENAEQDSIFIEAVRSSNGIYMGTAILHDRGEEILEGKRYHLGDEAELAYLANSLWRVRVEGDTSDFIQGWMKRTTFTELADASAGLGSLSVDFDDDGVFRRIPLLLRVDDAFYPTLPFKVICDYLGVTPDKITITDGAILLDGATRPGGEPRDLRIPINSRGEMIINYHGDWESLVHEDFADILLLSEDADLLESKEGSMENKIVVVAQISTGSADFGPVPTDNAFPLCGLHANAMNTILQGRFMSELSDLNGFLIEVLLVLLVVLFSRKFSSKMFFGSSMALAVLWYIFAVFGFLYLETLFNILSPVFSVATATLSILAYRYINEEKQKEVLRRSFDAYFPPAIVKKIVANPEIIYSKGQKKELTILFSDIKGFTNMSSTMTPDKVQAMLNEYFEEMVEISFAYGGTVDKFIGDGLMVFFGDPEPQEDHALRCVRCAIAMQKKMQELASRWESGGKSGIAIRVGINTGECIVGNMGSSKRLSYTVLGATVNLASRMESNAPVGGILITQFTNEQVKHEIPTRSMGDIKVKGLDDAVPVFEVLMDQV